MKRILVTGGSGFIGTNVIESLLAKGYEVINIDIKEPKIQERRVCWKNVDIREFDKLKSVFDEFMPDYVIHLAARTDLDGKRLEDYDSNVLGVENIIKCCEKLKLKKLLITSSMLVCRTGYIPNGEHDYKPSTFYGESKVETEKIVWKYSKQIGCEWAILRPTSIWGPWFDVPYRNFFDMVIKKKYFHIGNKGCTKTYGYVGNAVYEIEQLLFNKQKSDDKVYYIGDYEPTNIEIWANEIAEQLGYEIRKIPFWIIRCAAVFGDILKKLGISFPMTSFRLKNMTTNNVVNMKSTEKQVGELPYNRIVGIEKSLEWINSKKI